MMKFFILFILCLSTLSCTSVIGFTYELKKKYPQGVNISYLTVMNDSIIKIDSNRDNGLSSEILYDKLNKYEYRVKKINHNSTNLQIRRLDTLYISRKYVYYFNNEYKLIFDRINP